MDERLRLLIPTMCLLRDVPNCVQYYSDPSYLNPHQVLESIKLWHEDMVSLKLHVYITDFLRLILTKSAVSHKTSLRLPAEHLAVT